MMYRWCQQVIWSRKLAYGLVNGTRTVRLSRAFSPARLIGPRELPPGKDLPAFPVLIRRKV
jgi:hypothetical protein